MSLLQIGYGNRFAYDGPGQLVRVGAPLGWPEPIYMHFGYGFISRFSAGTIQPISMIFGNPKILFPPAPKKVPV